MKQYLPFLIAFTAILYSCNDFKNQTEIRQKRVDYSNNSVLDSLIKNTAHSSDTLFLGFQIGMTKEEYKDHIHELRKAGKTLDYSNSNKFSTIAGTFDLGAGYTFETSITSDSSDKELTGIGKYFLEPVYNKGGFLMGLNILPIEKWNGDYGFEKPKWLESKIKENSKTLSDDQLKEALIENEIVDKYDFVREKNNLIIYENTLTINYIDLKTLYTEILIKKTEKEIIKEENKDVQF